jgi:alkylation response protein AidB-like acyl-CoA dehydrogenase
MSNELSLSLSHAPLTTLSDDEALFRDAVAGFANDEVRPRVQQMERDGKLDPTLIKKFFEMGLMGIEVADQYGGADGSLFMVALGVEEISKVDPAAAILMDVQNTLVNYPIRSYGSDYIKSTYLPQLAGEKVGAYALSEASSGSDAFGMQARAEQRGDRWILLGRKM